ncbi:hypothetical protein [Photobacterium nomapromontoriensis]|uniref:hypothetical protein n=1 Tax=Photobacterium nomapromontoriensis TaxID=2910237 RepID=UPI003D14D237
MNVESDSRLLIADTTDILDAFLDNGLHRDFQIYCQFPHCATINQKVRQAHPLLVEFNDGIVISAYHSLS